jgi:diguanylate cyclase (GGDEF)-like protein
MNAPLDPKTLFDEGLEAYFAPLLVLIVFSVVVAKNLLMPRSMRRLFLYESGLLFILLVASWCDKCLEGFGDDGLAFYFRRGTTFINFAFSPLTCILAALLYRKRGLSRRDILLAIPEIVNIILCIVSLFYPVVFSISSTNVYSRGYLFLYPFAVNAFYASVVVYYSTKQADKPDLKLETIAVFVLFGSIFSAVIIQLALKLRYLIWSTTIFAMAFYYVILFYGYVMYDQLTGAFSRDAFRLMFQNRRGKEGVIAMIDLNGLKEINDQQGHEKGDQALVNVSQILLHAKSKNSRLYRYGGDEFVLVAHHCDLKSVQVLLAKAEIDAGALEQPLSFAYGVVEIHDGDDLYSQLEKADVLMYEMKRGYKSDAKKKPVSEVDL